MWVKLTDRRGQSLIAASAIRRHSHGDRQFKIVARCSETLSRGEFIREAQGLRNPDRRKEYYKEVNNQRSGDTDDRYDLVHNSVALGGEQNDDGIK